MTSLLPLILVFNLAALVLLVLLLRRGAPDSSSAAVTRLGNDMLSLERGLGQSFAKSAADMAQRLEQTKGDLRQEVADRLTSGFKEIHSTVEQHLVTGRREQTAALTQARTELTSSLATTTAQLKNGVRRRSTSAPSKSWKPSAGRWTTS